MTTNSNTTDTKNSKTTFASAMQAAKTVGIGLFSKLRRVLRGMNFWFMALICLGLRCFVRYPLGQLLALIVGTVWCFENWVTIRNAGNRLVRFIGGFAKGVSYGNSSMWYEQEGEKLISNLIDDLSKKGVRYCNLAEHIKMPPESHWHSISVALTKKGIRTQVSKDAFYISWTIQGQQAS